MHKFVPITGEIVSLAGIGELRKAFPNAQIGFSDHSIGPSMALAAVALGSVIIERHFTLSRYLDGPDIACKWTPVSSVSNRPKFWRSMLHTIKTEKSTGRGRL